jgi:hypothetical protein
MLGDMHGMALLDQMVEQDPTKFALLARARVRDRTGDEIGASKD